MTRLVSLQMVSATRRERARGAWRRLLHLYSCMLSLFPVLAAGVQRAHVRRPELLRLLQPGAAEPLPAAALGQNAGPREPAGRADVRADGRGHARRPEQPLPVPVEVPVSDSYGQRGGTNALSVITTLGDSTVTRGVDEVL